MMPNQETELTFTLLDSFFAIDMVPLLGGDKQTHFVTSTYYDTPERQLQATNWSVRTRSQDLETVQTVKGPMTGAQRPEFEVPIDSETLDFDELKKTPVWQIIESEAD